MLTLTKRLSKRKSFTILMLLAVVTFMFSSPISALASAQNNEDCNSYSFDGDFNVSGANYIDGEEKSEVLRGIEASSIFENNVNHESINGEKSKVINLGENEYANGDVLQVTSLYENSTDDINHDMLTVFVEKDSKKVLKLSYFEIDSEIVDYKDFDETGRLMIHKEFTFQDLSNGDLENGITHYSIYDGGETGIQSGPSGFWEKLACSFSGEVACLAGCVASFAAPGIGGGLYAICSSTCSIVWSAGLC